MESVQDVDSLRAPGKVNHALGPALIRNANLFHVLACGGNWFEIVRWPTALHIFQFIAGVLTRILREFPQILQKVAKKTHQFYFISRRIYS